jgi:hypothetical protein
MMPLMWHSSKYVAMLQKVILNEGIDIKSYNPRPPNQIIHKQPAEKGLRY